MIGRYFLSYKISIAFPSVIPFCYDGKAVLFLDSLFLDFLF